MNFQQELIFQWQLSELIIDNLLNVVGIIWLGGFLEASIKRLERRCIQELGWLIHSNFMKKKVIGWEWMRIMENHSFHGINWRNKFPAAIVTQTSPYERQSEQQSQIKSWKCSFLFKQWKQNRSKSRQRILNHGNSHKQCWKEGKIPPPSRTTTTFGWVLETIFKSSKIISKRRIDQFPYHWHASYFRSNELVSTHHQVEPMASIKWTWTWNLNSFPLNTLLASPKSQLIHNKKKIK